MAVKFMLDSMISDVSSSADAHINIVSLDEFETMSVVPEEAQDELKSLEADETNYIVIHPNYYIGSLSIPKRGKPSDAPELIAFYLDSTHLLLITESKLPEDILREVATDNHIPSLDCARCLFFILNKVVGKDLTWLSTLEDQMEDLEESILGNADDVTTKTMIKLRRIATKQEEFYEEVGDIAEVLANDVSDIVSEAASRRFQNLASHCDRLSARTESLKEYSMQLHDLYQTQLDERQNRIMEIFTIVTVIIAPLTLITGWFGMNIPIPGLQFDYMWIIVLVVSVLITAGVIVFVRRRSWL